MTAEDQLILHCARQRFHSNHRRRVFELYERGPLQWDYIYETAQLHGVAPLIGMNLKACADSGLWIPYRILDRFSMCQETYKVLSNHRNARLSHALSFFKQYDIQTMLVHGTWPDGLVYREPWYTEADRIRLILRTSRASLTGTSDEEIVDRFYPDIEHVYFEDHDLTLNGLFPIQFCQVWENAVKIDHAGKDVMVMSPEDLLISACINSFRKQFFKLKYLCDIAEIINNSRHLQLDLSKMAKMANIYRCSNVVYTSLLLTSWCLGNNVPEQLFSRLAVHPLKARAIRFLINQMSVSTLADLYRGQSMMGAALATVLLPDTTTKWRQTIEKVKENLENTGRMGKLLNEKMDK